MDVCTHTAYLPAHSRYYGETSGEQAGHCLFDENKVRQHLLKSLQEGKMTPLPLKKNRRNRFRLKTWNMVYLYIGC